ncbi:hypothetical protein AB990_01320 [Alkalihalobacillus pseudalcaliphilus]|nr:hypothetical protein AB990_01320 [Alkalihalobacillus pseudalcaliphilus]
MLVSSIYYIFYFDAGQSLATVIFKLTPMLLIIFYSLFYYRKVRKYLAIVLGLIVCMIADGVIVYSFLGGLIVFLTGHIFYLYAFLKISVNKRKSGIVSFPFLIYMTIMGYLLISAMVDSGETALVIPVILYILVIGFMGITAVWTNDKYAMIGAILFIISDSFLAWNMFVESISYSHVWIMTTYYGAQFFIATSIGYFNKR